MAEMIILKSCIQDIFHSNGFIFLLYEISEYVCLKKITVGIGNCKAEGSVLDFGVKKYFGVKKKENCLLPPNSYF